MKTILLLTAVHLGLAFSAYADVDTLLYNKYWDEDSGGLYHTNPNDKLGTSFANGDFNNDGYEDLAIGEPGFSNASGDVMVLYGTGSGVSSVNSTYLFQATPQADAGFGTAMAVGDFDGDGIDDLAVSAPYYDVTVNSNILEDAGVINIFYGSNSGLSGSAPEINENTGISNSLFWTASAFNKFGFSLAAGNTYGDAKDELAVGIPGAGIAVGFPPVTQINAGRVRIYNGNAAGITNNSFDDIWQGESGTAGSPEQNDSFGYSLAMGYFNAGNKADLAVGVPFESFNATLDGIVQVFYGGVSGFANNIIITQNDITGATAESGDFFGYSLATGLVYGGFNDFYDDLIIGVPFEDVGTITDAGVVNIMPGSSTGLVTTNSYSLSQNTPGIFGGAEQDDHFGQAVGTAYLSNNGVVFSNSILIGAPGEDFHALNDGVAYVVFDSSGSSATSQFLSAPNPNDDGQFGSAVSSVTTFFDNAHSYRFTSVFVGIPGQTSADNDTNAGAFLESVFQGNDLIFKHGFE